MAARTGNIFKQDVFDTRSRCFVVSFVVEDTKSEQLTLPEIFHPDIFELDITGKVFIAHINAHTSLVVYLHPVVVRYVDSNVKAGKPGLHGIKEKRCSFFFMAG